MLKSLMFAVAFVAVLPTFQAEAQDRILRDYFRDYHVLTPRAYSPEDPSLMGRILRIEVGHGGLFYNCDNEESKRCSPYIKWHQQNQDCCQHLRLIRFSIRQQLAEVKQRIRWGGCDDCGGKSCGCCQCDSPAAAVATPTLASKTNAGSRKFVDELLHTSRQKHAGSSNVMRLTPYHMSTAQQDAVVKSVEPPAITEPATTTEKSSGFLAGLMAPTQENPGVTGRGMGVSKPVQQKVAKRRPSAKVKRQPQVRQATSSSSGDSEFRMLRR